MYRKAKSYKTAGEAVAACSAVLQFYEGRGIDVFADDRYYPNQFVYNKVMKALQKED